MKIVNGEYASAKIFTDNVEDIALQQIQNLVNHSMAKDTTVRIMPDVHAGAGSTIGTVIKLPKNFEDWEVSPNIVGVDIDCGVLMYKLSDKDIDLKKLDIVINKYIPSGFNVREMPANRSYTQDIIDNLSFEIISHKDVERVHCSLGTLGGGNHFVELGVDEDNNYWLSVHSGSRGFGHHVASYHQDIAIKELIRENKVDINPIIKQLKEENRHKEIEHIINSVKKDTIEITHEAKQMATLRGELLKNYIFDMELAQQYGRANRKAILDIIVDLMGFSVVDKFDSEHNFIEHNNFTDGYIRKGATSAKRGERLVIPLNMRDGSLIAEGKGNEDWNYSAPHGAGRLMSRGEAKEKLNLDDFKSQMSNIYSTSVGESTIDEAPDAYKPASEIIDCIGDTVEIIHLVSPVYNFKAK